MTMAIAALITHALATAISALAMGQVQDLIHRLFLKRVDGRSAHLSSKLQAVRMIIDYEHLRGTLDHGRVGSHQTNRAGAVDGNTFPGKEACQLGCMPTSREDVGEHDVIFFTFLRVLGQHQAVEVCIRHSK